MKMVVMVTWNMRQWETKLCMCFMQMIMKEVKTMTFDEAIEVLANSENNKLVKEGQLEYGLYRAYDVVSVLQKLRQEYAPTVEMTKEQYEILVLSRNNAVNRVDKVGLLEFMSAYSLLNQEIDHLSLMQAWLHPENIKVVDE